MYFHKKNGQHFCWAFFLCVHIMFIPHCSNWWKL